MTAQAIKQMDWPDNIIAAMAEGDGFEERLRAKARCHQMKRTPIGLLQVILDGARKIDPKRILDNSSPSDLAVLAERELPSSLLGPAREEYLKFGDKKLPDNFISRTVSNDTTDEYRRNLDEAFKLFIARRGVTEKCVARMLRHLYAKRLSVVLDLDVPFGEKINKALSADDQDFVLKLNYWVFPDKVSAPRLKEPEMQAYLASVTYLSCTFKFIEGYAYYMRPPGPELHSTETTARLAALLVYVRSMYCKLASLFDAIDAAVLRSKFNRGASAQALTGIYGYTRNGKGTIMSRYSSEAMSDEIMSVCRTGSDTLIESLRKALGRLTYLIARWELISVEKKRDAKEAVTAALALSGLVSGHLGYLLNLISMAYVFWLPGHYLNMRLILALSSRELLSHLLATNPSSLREVASCPKILFYQSVEEWRGQERGTQIWLDYVTVRAWLDYIDTGIPTIRSEETNASINEISEYLEQRRSASPTESFLSSDGPPNSSAASLPPTQGSMQTQNRRRERRSNSVVIRKPSRSAHSKSNTIPVFQETTISYSAPNSPADHYVVMN
uniref:Tegument protein VP11/12 n=1 Tax=Infectious laryngotracheitis virus TaxID=10386 RepID=A0A7M3URL4_ILTV|nr:tegument protein VP11/12 [Gallid alphaherpesvirus 1]